jgi:hypothetical protein
MVQRLVAGLSPQRSGFTPGLANVGFVVDKVAMGQVPPRILRFCGGQSGNGTGLPPPLRNTSVFPYHFHSKRYFMTRKKKGKKLIIIITGLHNKLQHYRAFAASSSGSLTTKKKVKFTL